MSERGSRRRRIDDLFRAALERSAEARDGFVDAQCAEDHEIRAAVRKLLAAAEGRGFPEAGRALDGAFGHALTRELESASPPPRSRIGPFRVIRELGGGGMGTVYLAERAAGDFEQRVAVKVIKRGMDSDAILKRFLLERRILARLEHPGIAHLIDGGLTEDGQPYFAMEFVDGEPLTDYCDARRLGIRQRLKLFEQVCAAIRYAHGQLVIHRDLKPSNMLVTVEGELKLLDFGIAKLLGPSEQAEETELTRLGVRPLTPDYAAPEQLSGEPVTMASDVYALGVVLYELLAGRRPRDRQTDVTARTGAPIERPSAAVDRATDMHAAAEAGQPLTPESIAGSRGMRPDRLRRRLMGDLDTIVLQALREEPEQRYASVDRLLEDIQRHLAGLPITARPATLAYRAGKFVRRNLLAVSGSGLLAVSLVAGLAGTAWQARVATVERDRAQAETAKARAVGEYLVSIFRAAAPEVARGETVTAQQLVDRGVERIDEELADQPEVREEMLRVLSNVERELGGLENAELLARRAHDIARELYGREHPTAALAAYTLAHTLEKQGKWEEAEQLLRAAIDVQRRLPRSDSKPLTDSLDRLARVVGSRGRDAEAETLFRAALEIRRELYGDTHESIAKSVNNLGLHLFYAGRYDEAHELLHEALAIRAGLGHDMHPSMAIVLNNLSMVAGKLGHYRDALDFIQRTAAIEARTLDPDHPSSSMTFHNMARVEMDLGDYATAARRLEDVLVKYRRAYDSDNLEIGKALSMYGESLGELGELDEALEAQREAQRIVTSAVGREHVVYWITRAREALVLGYLGEGTRARRLMEEAIEHLRIVRGADNPLVAEWLDDLASMRLLDGDPDGARRALQEALAIQRQHLPPAHPHTVATLVGLGWAALARDAVAEACAYLEEASTMAFAVLADGHWRRAEASAALGACLSASGRVEEADPLLRNAYAVLVDARYPDHPDLTPVKAALRAHDLRTNQ